MTGGGNLLWSLIAIIGGVLLGTFFMAFHSAQGPQLGLPQMIQSRPQFGYVGARGYYADKLGLTPSTENPGMLTYRTAGGTAFTIYETQYAGMAGHAIAQWHVDDIESVGARAQGQRRRLRGIRRHDGG